MDSKKSKSFIARLLISSIFIYAIPDKIINFKRTVEVISSKNIDPVVCTLLLVCSIFCLIFGSIFFISGYKQKLGSILLLIFIVPTTFLFHFFPFQIRDVLMNAGLVGGLLLGLNTEKESALKDLFYKQQDK